MTAWPDDPRLDDIAQQRAEELHEQLIEAREHADRATAHAPAAPTAPKRSRRCTATTPTRGRPWAAQDIKLEPFVRDFFESLTTTADRRFELAGEAGGTLRADPDRLAQALHNLARNAIQHTTEGGLVRFPVTDRQEQVELAVEDDGPGIRESERTRVFDRFHRAETRRRSGSGLGLSIVSAIAAAHHGSVKASTSPEGGARVAIVLPGWRSEAGTRTADTAISLTDDERRGLRAGGGAARGVH